MQRSTLAQRLHIFDMRIQHEVIGILSIITQAGHAHTECLLIYFASCRNSFGWICTGTLQRVEAFMFMTCCNISRGAMSFKSSISLAVATA